MKIPFTDVIIPKRKIVDLLWGIYPVCLFYGMLAVSRDNFITREIEPPQGEIFGMLLFALPSFFISAILYKPIDSFKGSKRQYLRQN